MRKINTIIYNILLTVFVFFSVLKDSNYQLIGNLKNILSYPLDLVLILMVIYLFFLLRKVKINSYLLFIVIGMIISDIFIMIYHGFDVQVFTMFIFAICSFQIDFNKIIKDFLFTYICGCLFIFLSCKFGIIENSINVRYSSDLLSKYILHSNMYIRNSFGFIFSNQVPFALMTVYMLLILLKKEKLKWYHHFIVQILNLYTYVYCGSRTIFIIVFILMILYLWLPKIYMKTFSYNSRNIILKGNIFIYLTFISLLSIILFTVLPYKINVILNFRLENAYSAFKYYGLSIFGSGYSAGSSEGLINIIVDNGYQMLFLQRGVIFGALEILLWTYITKKSIKEKNIYFIIVVYAIAIANFIDYQIISYRFLPIICYAFKKTNLKQELTI